MFTPKAFSVILAFFVILQGSKCQSEESKKILNKIQFDYAAVNDKGMVNNNVAIDYEFCIPMDEDKAEEVRKIEPNVVIPRMAKGRIGCSDNEWLCIVSTNDAKWKEKLYAIASLSYVKRIVQTDYE